MAQLAGLRAFQTAVILAFAYRQRNPANALGRMDIPVRRKAIRRTLLVGWTFLSVKKIQLSETDKNVHPTFDRFRFVLSTFIFS
jgi:hypothetical protein